MTSLGYCFFADFEKAFDTIEHNFINRALKYFKFGNDTIRWIDVFYKDISSCVINNGHASTFFDISRGVRQGCPLSSYLFVICIELLALSIRNDTLIRGISTIHTDVNKEIKVSLYADDTTLLLPGNESALRKALQIFDKFRVCSWLKLNFLKMQITENRCFEKFKFDILLQLRSTMDKPASPCFRRGLLR